MNNKKRGTELLPYLSQKKKLLVANMEKLCEYRLYLENKQRSASDKFNIQKI
jgi:hypothetical protein